MDAPQIRSVYERGKRHMAQGIIGGLAVIWGIPITASALGLRSDKLDWIVIPLMITWVLYFGLKSFLISCSKCSRSVFMRGYFWSVPWPAHTCGKCGNDLTAA